MSGMGDFFFFTEPSALSSGLMRSLKKAFADSSLAFRSSGRFCKSTGPFAGLNRRAGLGCTDAGILEAGEGKGIAISSRNLAAKLL